MKKAGQWKNRMVLALELPPDLAYNETIVTLTGQTEAVIENYKSVFKYTPSEIVIQSFCGKVTISGKNLRALSLEELAALAASIYPQKQAAAEKGPAEPHDAPPWEMIPENECDHPCKRRKSGTLSESLQKQKSLYGKDPVQRGRPAYGTNAGR